MRRAEVRLDGNSIWDSGEKPLVDELIKVAERPIKPGPHALTLRLEVRPGKKSEKEHEELGYEFEHTSSIIVPDGKRTTVEHHGRRGRRPARVRAGDRGRDRDGEMMRLCSCARRWLLQPCRRRAAAAGAGSPIRWRQYLADLEKAGVLTDDKDAGDAGAAARRARRRRGRSGHRQRPDRQRAAVPDRRVAALREVRLRARVRERRADAGAGADPRGRLQVGRALPAARARARAEVARLRPRLPRAWSTSRSRRASRRRSWPCSITSARI